MENNITMPALLHVFNQKKEKINFQIKDYQLVQEIEGDNRKIYKVYDSGRKKLLFDFYKTESSIDQIGRKIDTGYIKKGVFKTKLAAQVIHEYDCLYVCYEGGIHSFEYQQMN